MITPSELELVVDPVMLVSMLCTCEILNTMLVLTMLILVCANNNKLIWVEVNEMATMFVCDIRVDRYLKSILTMSVYLFLQAYVIMMSEPMSSTSLERLSTLKVSQATQFRKKELLVMALVSLELNVKEV